MKILVLMGKFGMGHASAAYSLAQRIEHVNPEAKIKVVDFLEYAVPDYSDKLYQAFGTVVTRRSRLYNYYYISQEKKGPDQKPAFLHYFVKKAGQLVAEEQPDVIFCTLPLCAQIISRYKIEQKNRLPLITCITDISSHSEWINSGTSIYLVPSQSVKNRLREKGVSDQQIFVFGIPVREEFDQQVKKVSKKKKILIMGGGLGLLPKTPEFYERLNRENNLEITVITGKNKEMFHQLEGKYQHIHVVGYSDEVYRYMKEADVVISKPGGITLFESIHSETPLLVFEPFLQQEINNTGFIINHGIGMILKKDPQLCLFEISRIINDDRLLMQMKHNAQRLKQEYDQDLISGILKRLNQESIKSYGEAATSEIQSYGEQEVIYV